MACVAIMRRVLCWRAVDPTNFALVGEIPGKIMLIACQERIGYNGRACHSEVGIVTSFLRFPIVASIDAASN